MDLFTVIDDGVAIVRLPKGILKQTKVYRRGDRVFVPHGGGYLRVTSAFDGKHGTSHPDIKVDEIDAPDVRIVKGEPRFTPALAVAA